MLLPFSILDVLLLKFRTLWTHRPKCLLAYHIHEWLLILEASKSRSRNVDKIDSFYALKFFQLVRSQSIKRCLHLHRSAKEYSLALCLNECNLLNGHIWPLLKLISSQLKLLRLWIFFSFSSNNQKEILFLVRFLKSWSSQKIKTRSRRLTCWYLMTFWCENLSRISFSCLSS